METTTTYMVTAATGQQGRATIKHLLAGNSHIKIHALVRKLESPSAQEVLKLSLGESRITLFPFQDNWDIAAFRRAATLSDGGSTVRGVFLNLVPDPKAPQQAEGLGALFRELGVPRVVLASAAATGRPELWDTPDPLEVRGWDKDAVDYYRQEEGVEIAVRDAGLPSYSILRPAWLHSNYVSPAAPSYYPDLVNHGILATSQNPGVTLAHLDEDDMGKFAAAALLQENYRGDVYDGAEIELASENLTAEQARDALERAAGRPVKLYRRTLEESNKAKEKGVPAVMFDFLTNRGAVVVDVEELKTKFGIRMTTFEEYLMREKQELVIGSS